MTSFQDGNRIARLQQAELSTLRRTVLLEMGSPTVSSVTVYTQKDFVVKERLGLMNDTFSSVWLEVGLPRQKKILICNLYCEW